MLETRVQECGCKRSVSDWGCKMETIVQVGEITVTQENNLRVQVDEISVERISETYVNPSKKSNVASLGTKGRKNVS